MFKQKTVLYWQIKSITPLTYSSEIRIVRLEGYEMRKILFGISLLFIFSAGCANQQLHQTLLLQENQRLEEALYVTHAQLADLKRENDELRSASQTIGYDETIVPPRRSDGKLPPPDAELLDAPPFEMPKVLVPDQPGTTEVPASIKGSQSIPVWKPRR